MHETRTPPAHSWSAAVSLTAQFYDLDPLQVVWHGNYAKYFEHARCALLDQLGYNYPEMKASGYAWPIIDLHVRYAQPITFAQNITVRAEIVEWECRLRMRYLISDTVSARRLTRGETVQVAVDLATQQMCLQSPAILFEKLGVRRPW